MVSRINISLEVDWLFGNGMECSTRPLIISTDHLCHKYIILPRRLVLHRGWKDQACFKKLTDMARFPFGRLEETEIRKPSKVRMVFFILFLLLLILSVTFIALYFKEKIKSTDSTSEKIKSTYSPYTSEKNKPTNSPTAGTCLSPACATCSAGMLAAIFIISPRSDMIEL